MHRSCSSWTRLLTSSCCATTGARRVSHIDKVVDVPVVMRQSTGAFDRICCVFYVTVNPDPEVDSLLALEIWISTSPLYLAVTSRSAHASGLRRLFGRILFFCVKVELSRGRFAWFALGNLNIISTSSSYDVGDVLFAVKCGIVRAPPGRLELSASFRSPRWRRVLCHRGLLHNYFQR